MKNSRQKILDYILEEQSASVEELSNVFKVTPANIRHHLSILVEQGSLKIAGAKPKIGKGRPTQIYTARRQSDQNNLEQLTDTLLSTLLSADQSSDHSRLLIDVAKRMVSRLNVDKRNPTRQVYSSIRVLNRMNYLAHWEAHIDNPRIMLGHCPYQTILDRHPEICQLDAYLLQELFDSPVSHLERKALNSKGLPECVFLLNQARV